MSAELYKALHLLSWRQKFMSNYQTLEENMLSKNTTTYCILSSIAYGCLLYSFVASVMFSAQVTDALLINGITIAAFFIGLCSSFYYFYFMSH